MIETKEQWEEIKSDVQSDISTQHEKRLMKLIEALMEAAKALKEYVGMGEPGDKFPLPELQAEIDAYLKAKEAVDALPDWLTDG